MRKVLQCSRCSLIKVNFYLNLPQYLPPLLKLILEHVSSVLKPVISLLSELCMVCQWTVFPLYFYKNTNKYVFRATIAPLMCFHTPLDISLSRSHYSGRDASCHLILTFIKITFAQMLNKLVTVKN